MPAAAFDALACFEKLKGACVPEEQARIQAEAMRSQRDAQAEAIREIMADREKALATRADLKELELRLLEWQFGIALALAAIMAKGFGWLGF